MYVALQKITSNNSYRYRCEMFKMSKEEVFCLKWNDHNTNMQTVLCNLLKETAFCDVTLAAEGQSIQAHKLVLIACSEYFKGLLTPLKEGQHPLIILEGINFKELKTLLDYMYYGEVSVRYCSFQISNQYNLHFQKIRSSKSYEIVKNTESQKFGRYA